jgi:hypothetical protein
MESLHLSGGTFGVCFCEPLYDRDGWLDSFLVKIEESGLSVSARVHNSKYIQGPESLFRDIANNWRGWSGEKAWRALEGELHLCATTDPLGHITIRVQLRPATDPGLWRVTSFAHLEAGQLDSLADRAAKFFAHEP